MFRIDQAALFVSACALVFSATSVAAQATDKASHDVSTDGETVQEPIIDSGTAGDVSAISQEFLDTENAGAYRYFGLMTMDHPNLAPGQSRERAITFFAGLDPSADYLFMMLDGAIVNGGGGFFTFRVTQNPAEDPEDTDGPVFSTEHNASGVTPTGQRPVIVSGLSTLEVELYLVSGNNSGSAVGIVGLIEIVPNAANTANDCDIDDDGDVDADDIDLLCLALRSNVFATVTDADAIAIFDVDGDGSVDGADVDELVESPGCLDTLYGDLDLDGDVDTVDITTAFANFTGNLNGMGTMGWADGDTDCDGDVDNVDIATVIANFTGSP